ncbi:hypothetical protein ID866_4677 [Astraeus odoratus]|nr:hypothetical protein ID866_4677 [Astraeus odoratus]
MALLTTITGFSLFGLASRFGQLAIQRRNLMDSTSFSYSPPSTPPICPPSFHYAVMLTSFVDLGGHVVAMAVFGYAGYWAHVYETRTGEYLAVKRAEIAERRERTLAAEAEAANLAA